VKGIGPWTADYVALRCLRDDDAFPSGDLILRRALDAKTPAEAIRLAEPWRPWRGYATLHLWTAAVFVDAQQPADALPPA
jgi:3-methyladenine DNA glycosylase/8-oxoguanine DNA glycosylase